MTREPSARRGAMQMAWDVVLWLASLTAIVLVVRHQGWDWGSWRFVAAMISFGAAAIIYPAGWFMLYRTARKTVR